MNTVTHVLEPIYIPRAFNTGISQLVSWCFQASQPRRITKGLNTNITLPPRYSFHNSSYQNSWFLSLFTFRGNSTREPVSDRVTYLILRAYTGTMCQPHPTQEKSGEVLEKMQVNGPEGQIYTRKKSLAVSVACMATYWPAPGFKGRTFKLFVLTRWDFDFCVRSSPLRGQHGNRYQSLCDDDQVDLFYSAGPHGNLC